MIAFSATLTTGAVAGSQYGKLGYGQGLYSRYTPQTQSFAGNLAPTVGLSASLTVSAGASLAGNLAPTVAFGGALVATESLAGDLAPHVAFAGGLSRIAVVTGDLAPSVAFAGGLTVTPAVELAGNLAPAITFGPSQLTTPQAISGGLAPAVTFAANMAVIYAVTGDLASQIALGASLTGFWDLAGNMTAGVVLAATGEFGPLFAPSDACPLSAWDETLACPPPLWTPTVPPSWDLSGETGDLLGYGMRPYGMGEYNQFSTPWLPSTPAPPATWASSPAPVDPDWEPVEPCNGG